MRSLLVAPGTAYHVACTLGGGTPLPNPTPELLYLGNNRFYKGFWCFLAFLTTPISKLHWEGGHPLPNYTPEPLLFGGQ